MRCRWLMLFLVLFFVACDKKEKTDVFQEGKPIIELSSDTNRGMVPLYVNFSAYLENEARTFEGQWKEIKWLVRGSGDFRQEIVQESENFQDKEADKTSFFHFNYQFHEVGTYKVSLILNGGEYVSKPLTITVTEDPSRLDNRGYQ